MLPIKEVFFNKKEILKSKKNFFLIIFVYLALFFILYLFKILDSKGIWFGFIVIFGVLIWSFLQIFIKINYHLPAISFFKLQVELIDFKWLFFKHVKMIQYDEIKHLGTDMKKIEGIKIAVMCITLKNGKSVNYNLKQFGLTHQDFISIINQVNPVYNIISYGNFEYNSN